MFLRKSSKPVAKDEEALQKPLIVTQHAIALLETPPETVWKLLVQVHSLIKFRERHLAQDTYCDVDQKPHLNASIKIAIDTGLFDVLNEAKAPRQPQSWRVPLAVTSCSSVLNFGPVMLKLGLSSFLVRIVRPMAATQLIIETRYDTYQMNHCNYQEGPVHTDRHPISD